MGRFGKAGVKTKTGNVGNTASQASDFEGSSDSLLINAAVGKTRLYYPSKDRELVIRPWPALDPKSPETKFLRHRQGVEDKQQSDWITMVSSAGFVGSGKNRISFLLYAPDADEATKRGNPYVILYWNAYRAKKSGRWHDGKSWKGPWNALLERGTDTSPPLTGPDYMGFMQGAVLLHGDTNYLVPKGKRTEAVPYGFGDDDALPICRIGKTTALNLLAFLDKKKKNADDEDNIQKKFLYDVIGYLDKETGQLKGGRILEFYKTGKKVEPGEVSTWDGKPPENKLGQYSIHTNLHKAYKVGKGEEFSATLEAEYVKQIFNKANFWYDYDLGDGELKPGILRIMPYEEQAAEIAKAFKDVSGLVVKCWEENDEFMTDEVKGILAGRVSSSVPGGDDDDEDEDDEEETPKKKSKDKDEAEKPKAKKSKSAKQDDEDDEEEDDEDEDTEEEEDEDDDESDSEEEEDEDDSEDDDSEDDEEEEDDDDSEEDEDEDDSESEDEDDEEEDDSEDDEDEDDSESEDEEDEEEEEEEDDEEEEEEAPKKTKSKDKAKGDKSSKKKSKSEDDDEDLDTDEPLLTDDDIEAAKEAAEADDRAKNRNKKTATPPKPDKSGKGDKKSTDKKKSSDKVAKTSKPAVKEGKSSDKGDKSGKSDKKKTAGRR